MGKWPVPVLEWILVLALLISSTTTLLLASAKVIEHTFLVESVISNRLCKDQPITVVNGSLPGPTIYAEEGDTLIVHVINHSPYNMTIHWHGVRQLLSCWADGVGYVTQCPIRPENKYTYRFNISGQEGTLWWHAHTSFHRSTVYGALVIYPRTGRSYPFPKPDEDATIILGEWWNINITIVEDQFLTTGFGPNSSDAFLINGWPGDLYSCSSSLEGRSLNEPRDQKYSGLKLPSPIAGRREGDTTFKLKVSHGKTYLLRIINAALIFHNFFKIADHKMIVVGVDASYTNPYLTDTIMLTPGQTCDVLVIADQPPGRYYMATQIFRPGIAPIKNDIPATGILIYEEDGINSSPRMPNLPDPHDEEAAYKLSSSLTGLVGGPFWDPVPLEVDERMFITAGLGILPCQLNETCVGPFNSRWGGSLNNASFLLPTDLSVLEAYFENVVGIFTSDFPNEPPLRFDFTNTSYTSDERLYLLSRSTKVKRFKYNTTVEIVFQGTTLVLPERHPMHLHGFNFYVLGQGLGNYDARIHASTLNLENPVVRSTVDVPANGWVVVRFRTDNPGVWFIHCHNEGHIPIGLATAFIVEDGPTPLTMLPPPPPDLPKC